PPQIYNNDMLCFNLLIRYDGHVIDTKDTAAGVSGALGLARTLVDPTTGRGVPARTKVFDQSSIYMFKETFNLSITLQAAISILSDEEEETTEGPEVMVGDI